MNRGVLIAIYGSGALSIAACSGGGSMLGAGGAPPPASSVAAGALPSGAALGEADRQAAYDAQVGAVEAGERRSWRGAGGAFGCVEPGPAAETARGHCRPYAQTIYIGGRPQRGQGLACRQSDGSWRMAS
ncbi:MAG: hypothetical protein ACLPNY_03355 [Roseiarcus sp.]